MVDLVERLRGRTIQVDGPPDGRGGWHYRMEADPLCLEAATLIETQAARIRLLERGIEQAFRDGISYATNVDVKDVELAWSTSRACALNGGE